MQDRIIRTILRCGTSAGVIAAGLAAFGPAVAQQVLPGTSPQCTIVNGVATCSGDLSDGVRYYDPLPDIQELRIENVTGPIEPPGYFGIGYDVTTLPIRLRVADGVVINTVDSTSIVNPAQGIVAISANGNSIDLDTGAIITVDPNGQRTPGIEAAASGGAANVLLVNRGSVSVTNTAQEASAIRIGQQNATGTINVTNSGALTAVSGGTGERDDVTSGIVIVSNAGTQAVVNNSGDIAITTGPDTYDTNFQGYAGAIVVNMTAPSSTTMISNSGTITGRGPNTTALLGYTTNADAANASSITLRNTGAVTIAEVFDANIIMAQSGSGTRVDTAIENDGAITVANARNVSGSETVYFLQTLNAANASTSSITNTADLVAGGDAQVLIRGIGLSASGANARNGTYDFTVDNEGDMTFGTGTSQGIALFASAGDVVTASITNSGDLDFTSTVTGASPLGASEGIRAQFGAADAAETATGRSTLSIVNSGDVAMGAGNALIAWATSSTIDNSGALSTTAAGAHVVTLTGSPAGAGSPATSLDFTTSGDLTASGADADAIRVTGIADADLTIAQGATLSSGSGAASAGLRLTDPATAELAIAGTVRSGEGTAILADGNGNVTVTVGSGGLVQGGRAAIDSQAHTIIMLESGAQVVGDIALGTASDAISAVEATIDGDVSTGAGDDLFSFSDLTISGSIDLGDGNDVLSVAGINNSFATIIGGAGNDQVRYTTQAGFDAALDVTGLTVNGFELFIQDGPGRVLYTGSNSFTTGYELRGGTLVQAASLPNVDLTTLAGTSLTLGGAVRNLNVGGSLALGAGAPGTRTIGGNLVFGAGSTYSVSLAPGGADRLDAAGTVTINGGTVNVAAAAGSYIPGDNYVILSGAGGVTGTFANLSVTSTAFLDLTLAYTANQVLLALAAPPPAEPEQPPVLDFAPFALTFNESSASDPLPDFPLTEGSDTRAVYSQLLFLQTGQVASALDAVTGEIHAAVLASGLRLAGTLTRSMGDRSLAPLATEGLGGFITGFHVDGGIDGDGNAASIDHSRTGVAGGLDWTDTAGMWRAGLSVGWSEGEVDLPARGSSADLEGWQLGGYARFGTMGEGFSLRASAVQAWGEADVERRIAFGGISRAATSAYDLDTFAAEGEARYGLPLGTGLAAGPVVTIDYASAGRDPFSESGASSLNLSGGDDDDDRLALGAGGFLAFRGPAASVDLTVTYDHADGDPTETLLAYEGLSSAGFAVRSPRSQEDAVALRASAEIGLGGAWHLGASFRGRYASGEDESAGFLSISLR